MSSMNFLESYGPINFMESLGNLAINAGWQIDREESPTPMSVDNSEEEYEERPALRRRASTLRHPRAAAISRHASSASSDAAAVITDVDRRSEHVLPSPNMASAPPTTDDDNDEAASDIGQGKDAETDDEGSYAEDADAQDSDPGASDSDAANAKATDDEAFHTEASDAEESGARTDAPHEDAPDSASLPDLLNEGITIVMAAYHTHVILFNNCLIIVLTIYSRVKCAPGGRNLASSLHPREASTLTCVGVAATARRNVGFPSTPRSSGGCGRRMMRVSGRVNRGVYGRWWPVLTNNVNWPMYNANKIRQRRFQINICHPWHVFLSANMCRWCRRINIPLPVGSKALNSSMTAKILISLTSVDRVKWQVQSLIHMSTLQTDMYARHS